MNTAKTKRYLPVLLVSCLLLSFLFTGCSAPKESNPQTQESFDAFLEQLFITEIKKDGITFNYTLAHPENYGIEKVPDTLGEYTPEFFQKNLAETENYLSCLKDFSYPQLDENQKLTYDILEDYLNKEVNGSDYLLYRNVLSKTIGLQAQLPILFAEYNFSDQASVDTYLALLSDIERYFGQILSMEELKIKNGLFMSHDTAADIISQCKNFTSKKENNLLIQVFNDRIETIEGLSDEQRDNYRDKNRQIVLDSVIPAYQNIISFLTEHQDDGINKMGLSYFPEGKAYYEHLVQTSTGTSKTIKEVDKALDQQLKFSMMSMQSLLTKDPSLLDKAGTVSYPMTDPAKILSYLEEAIKTDYPEMEPVDYSIKYVHESLQPDISPAFYLTPQIDNPNNNNIYINPYHDYDLSHIFTTLAHEGYPGHLYQNVYFSRTNPSPVRSLLNYTGYSEGWATYVEMNSYAWSGIDTETAEFLRENNLATLCMYGKIDVGVNYYGWDLEKTISYLKDFGVTDKEIAGEIYQSMIAEPGNYLNYILGYIEIRELKTEAQKKLQEDFVLKDFHDFLLSSGPASFDVLENHMKTWIKNR